LDAERYLTEAEGRHFCRKQGDSSLSEEQFFTRVDTIKERLYKIAYAYLGDKDKAMDAVDEAVYKGYVKRKQLREETYFETWLTRILINVCNQALRHMKRELPYEELPEDSQQEFDSLPLKLAIQALPEDLRRLITLRYFGGFTISEAAGILKMPQGTAATRLRKALKLLRLDMEV
jgi:RNA polymerase sigma-70 factor (ECF subfamily)